MFKMFVETLKKNVMVKIVAVITSKNPLKFLNNAITVKLHFNYTVITH